MTEKAIRASKLLENKKLVGGDIEFFWHPDFSERGSHTHRWRIAKVKDGKGEIIFECKWVARWNKREKAWKVARRVQRRFTVSKSKPQYSYEGLKLRDDGSISKYIVGCPLPPSILSQTTIYPRGHKEVLKEADVRGL